MAEKNEKTFEQAVSRIDEIVAALEKGDAQLDKSLVLFEEGVKLIEMCGELLDHAEQTVMRSQNATVGQQRENIFNE